MPQKASANTDAAWTRLLAEAVLRAERLPVGDGWMTVAEISTRHKLSMDRTYTVVRDGLESGKLEKFQGSVRDGSRLRKRVWYRPT
jgi:hypothetical protein